MTRLKAIEASFIHWASNYGLVCRGKLAPVDIEDDKCPLCFLYRYQYRLDRCENCPLVEYGMRCEWADTRRSLYSPWSAVDYKMKVENHQPKRAVEVMTLCLLLVYYAENGKKVWK